MSYPIDVFETLCKQYPTWTALQAYLTSQDGGNFRVSGEGRYCILRYSKGVSDLNRPYGKWMRSVVWDTETNRPVCIAPPKAEPGDGPGEGVLLQDYLDGMMVNVFTTKEEPNRLQIATRSQIGAGGKFYSEKTFAEMFEEALVKMGLTHTDVITLMGPHTFASFVLQHPDHRVVARCRSAHLWIVHTGYVSDTGYVLMNERCESWPVRVRVPSHQGQTDFETTCEAGGWFYQGMVFKDGNGNRWRKRNPKYLYLRSLRGSEATAADRFVRLRSESKVSEYLKHYSEDREEFWTLEQTLRAKSQEVFQAYCDVHKARTLKLGDLPFAIKPCVFKLHSHYLEHLRPNNETIQMKHVVELVNNLPLFEQKRLLTTSSQASASSLA